MFIQKTLQAIGVIAIVFSLLWVANYGIEKHERAECLQWAYELNGNYEHLREYVANWQYSQCEALGVPLPTSP